MKVPSTGEIKTEEEFPLFVKIGESVPVGWNFAYEWELVPGEWTLQILQMNKDILAEEKFTVTKADDIYRYIPEMGKKIKSLKVAISKDPQNAGMIKNLGNIYLHLEDYDQAIALYSRAIAIEPHPNYYNNRCLTWNEKGEFDRAMSDCNKAIELYPGGGHTSALINRGNTYRLTSDYDRAIADYNKSLEAAPPGDNYNPPMAYFNRGLAYEAKGEFEKAETDYAKVLKLKPNHLLAEMRIEAIRKNFEKENSKDESESD